MAENSTQPAEGGKKRKRTGKQREEAKPEAAGAAALEPTEENISKDADAPEGGKVPGEDGTEAAGAVETAEKPEGPAVDFEKMAKRIALKKLHPVFKKAKKMESMRLIKKIRSLRTKESGKVEAAELEAQLKLFSSVDLHAVATTHLRQKLKKHHLLKRAALPGAVQEALASGPSIAASSSSVTPAVISKVENRLCSSKPVADGVKPAVAWVMSEPGAVLDLGRAPKGSAKGIANKRGGASSDEDSEDDEAMDADSESGEEGVDDIGVVEGLDSDDEAIMEDKAADAAGWESGDLGEEDGDDGWESGSVSGGEYNIAPPSSGGEGGTHSGDDSDSASSAVVPAPKRAKTDAKAKPEVKAKAPVKAAAKRATTSSSMFLPSLATGFTPGDGDSDPDMDYDADGVIGTKQAPRKNRRGQRARQAIWEKKYGKNAAHVVKARAEQAQGPKSKQQRQWGAAQNVPDHVPQKVVVPRGPPGGGDSGGPKWKQPQEGGPADGGWARFNSMPRAAPAAPAPKTAEKKMHPSWEAAMKRKQMAAAPNAPKATKIVFD